MRKMKNFHFGIIIIQILLLTVINYGDSTSVPNKDELFTINITMTNIMTTQVNMRKNTFLFSIFVF